MVNNDQEEHAGKVDVAFPHSPGTAEHLELNHGILCFCVRQTEAVALYQTQGAVLQLPEKKPKAFGSHSRRVGAVGSKQKSNGKYMQLL